VLGVLRWLLPSVVPAVLVAVVIWRADKEREPPALVALTFALGVLFSAGSFYVEGRAAAWSGLDVRTSQAGEVGALLFLFALAAPLREAAKVAACWPAFRSRHFDEPIDGLVYGSAAALGFASWENVVMLRANAAGNIWVVRALVALPAHLFCACLWAYALGRAKQSKRPGAIFPATWFVAMLLHGLYIYFVYGRGPAALVMVVPLLMAMGAIAFYMARDLRRRGERQSRFFGSRLSSVSMDPMMAPPSLRSVRDRWARAQQTLAIRWVLYGALVTLGAMMTGLALAIAFGAAAQVDFSIVDEKDVSTTAPVALLGAGLLMAFPFSGFLIAKASHVPSLLEPALATGLALGPTLVVLGLAAPVAVVFALAFSPIAFGLACAGAYVGKSGG